MTPTEEIRTRLVELLLKVPRAERGRFAQIQLNPKHAALARHFGTLSAAQRARTILFVSLQPHSRETRLADAARTAGWDTLLLHQGSCRYDASCHFSFHAQVEDMLQLVLACWIFPGALIHIFALRGDHALLLCATKNKPTVVDFYDTCAGFLSATPAEKYAEQQALAQADGITMRDLRVKYLERLHGYTLPRQRVFIHDPPPDRQEDPAPMVRPPDDPIRVVSVGWADGGEHSFLRISRAFCAAGIHVHLFLNPHQDAAHPDLAGYHRLQEENPCFHLEAPVFGEAYSRKLRGYDFGLAISERFIFGEPSTFYTPDYLAGCGSSRLTDFIQLGLGVIVSPQFRFQHYWAKRYAPVTVSATRELLANPLPLLTAARTAKFPRSLAPITVPGVATRLNRFYEEVAGGPNLERLRTKTCTPHSTPSTPLCCPAT